MLQALLHNKICKEDNLTSSSLGILQFLPDDMFLNILKGACGNSCSFPSEIGTILSFNFWPRLNAMGSNNSSYVEPDLWIEAENCHILIEVKRIDDANGYAQSKQQWFKEIKSLINEVGKDNKNIFLIALGGIDNHLDSFEIVDGIGVPIYTASWFNLLNSLINLHNKLIQNQSPNFFIRTIETCINGLNVYGFFQCSWFETMPYKLINKSSLKTLVSLWDINSGQSLGSLTNFKKVFSNITLSDIWTIK